MVQLFKTIQPWQYALTLLSGCVLAPAWIPACMMVIYTWVNFASLDKKKMLIIKSALIIIFGLMALLLFQFLNFDFVEKRTIAITIWAFITNVVLQFLGKKRNTEWFVYVFFIGVLTNFNLFFMSVLYIGFFYVLYKKYAVSLKAVGVIFGILGCVNLIYIHYMESKDFNLTKLTLFLIDPKTSMDTTFNGYTANPEGRIMLDKKGDYLAINSFDFFNKEKEIWEESPSEVYDFSLKTKRQKLTLTYDCQCSDIFKKSIKPSFVPGASGIYIQKNYNKNEHYIFDSLPLKPKTTSPAHVGPIIQSLKETLQSEGFVYDKNISKMISSKNNDDFFKTYKVGLCRHFASYAAHYLRARGIDANVVIGFASRNNELTDTFYFKDAHAWVEYFNTDNKQWERFDGTSLVPLNEHSNLDLIIKIVEEEYSWFYVVLSALISVMFLKKCIMRRYIRLSEHPWLLYKQGVLTELDYNYWEGVYAKRCWKIRWFIYCMKNKK